MHYDVTMGSIYGAHLLEYTADKSGHISLQHPTGNPALHWLQTLTLSPHPPVSRLSVHKYKYLNYLC